MLLSLHNGIIRVGLQSPADGFLSYVDRALGFWEKLEQGEPDLVVRHVEKLTLAQPPLLLNEAVGCAGSTFFICDHDGSKAVLPFGDDDIPEIVAESGFRPATLYVLAIEPFVQLALLKRGYSFVHSSAFELDGQRVLLAAGGHVGKTSFLLRALSAGAQYLADDWSILSDGGDLLGYPRPLRIFEYNTDDLPALRRRLPVGRRAMHAGISGLRHGYQRLRPSNSFAHRLLGRVVDLAVQVSQAHMRVEDLYSTSLAPMRAPLSVACFMASWEGVSVELSPMRPEEISRRIAASYAHEHADFFDSYEQYAAVTGSSGDLKGWVLARTREIMMAALGDVPCCSAKIPVSVPRDVAFSALRERLMDFTSKASPLRG